MTDLQQVSASIGSLLTLMLVKRGRKIPVYAAVPKVGLCKVLVYIHATLN